MKGENAVIDITDDGVGMDEETSNIFNLLSDCYKLILIADTLSEQSRQRSRHYHHFLILLSFSHPDNRIQRIIQKMWIDLRLQGFQFYFALLISSLIARNITLPIQKLRDSMKSVQKGNFDIEDIEVISDNEIGSLTRSFYVMTHRIRELMEQKMWIDLRLQGFQFYFSLLLLLLYILLH